MSKMMNGTFVSHRGSKIWKSCHIESELKGDYLLYICVTKPDILSSSTSHLFLPSFSLIPCSSFYFIVVGFYID